MKKDCSYKVWFEDDEGGSWVCDSFCPRLLNDECPKEVVEKSSRSDASQDIKSGRSDALPPRPLTKLDRYSREEWRELHGY